MPTHHLPYGLWPSPITPGSLAEGRRLSDLWWDGTGETLVWLEGRSGKGVLVCAGAGGDAPRDLTSELSVRARVGYGGGDMTVAGEWVYFVSEGRLYRQHLLHGAPRAITPPSGDAAAPTVSPDGRHVVYVYSLEGADGLAVVDAEGELWPQRLAWGDDFYMQPTWHPDGRRLAWVSWNHPCMPWDATRLHLAALDVGGTGVPFIVDDRVVAGDEGSGGAAAIFQPAFSPDGRYLAYISDLSGWDNLYLMDLASGEHRLLVGGEVDLGKPAWAQGMRAFAWAPDGATIYYERNVRGVVQLWAVDVASGATHVVDALAAYTDVSQVAVSATGRVAVIASSPRIPTRIVCYHPATGTVRVCARSETETVPPEILSEPEAITWRADDGELVHGLYYAPDTSRFHAEGAPPLIVMVHGGPTGQTRAGYASRNAFFTTRGYAVLEVNYRGSSGYGRRYRNLLHEQWGVYDVEDAVGGARHLVAQGRADPQRLVIMGGSAGGFTVLQALIHHPGFFRAGICLYGVTNLFALAAETHKFEQHYLDTMIGPLPETSERYWQRSPVFHADRIRDAMAIFQGEEDRVVPVSQAEAIVEALRRNGVPHVYHLYPGEGHGWRRSETIKAFYEAVLAFLRQYVLFG
ncbi:MAG TPA: prolyl oligopeptidase family serine peptidase [Chloroflexi bacterium]|jgi:dipeptidyl aminopeptidase/acylaminoacyl peptidase|nr:prolyl oligopeptidase family serine peptidase [Chloroflexota bacterium]